jgi:aromatic amino acid aminotransferase I
LSKECLARQPCILKQAAKHLKQPNLISLGGGLPSPSYFPVDKLSLQLAIPPSFSEEDGVTVSMGKFDMTEKDGKEYDLSVALNYGQAQGSAQMLRWITEHAEIINNPKYHDWGCSASSGSTGAFEIAARMFCNVSDPKNGREAERDKILVEEYSFSTAVETLEALGVTPVSVKMDSEGIVPKDLERIMSGWDARRGRKPHVLYTVPTGQNPTGSTQSAERRKKIYDVCEKHNLFIIEDDPYYFLTMPTYPSSPTKPTQGWNEGYISSLPPTYLSLDHSGRVLRLDSFSKVLVPGARMGFVTGPTQVVERFIRYMESAQGPSGFSQAALHTILDRSWGHEGYLSWLSRLSREYARRRDILVKACEEEMPDVVSWVAPRAGMFVCEAVSPALTFTTPGVRAKLMKIDVA